MKTLRLKVEYTTTVRDLWAPDKLRLYLLAHPKGVLPRPDTLTSVEVYVEEEPDELHKVALKIQRDSKWYRRWFR